MINIKDFYDVFYDLGLEFYTGVPDVSLKDFDLCIYASQSSRYFSGSQSKDDAFCKKNNIQNAIAPNAESAMAIAVGYYLATNKCPVVYMPNTCIGGAVNIINSTVNRDACEMPMMIVVGMRGVSDSEAPYHRRSGLYTHKITESINAKTFIIDSETDYSKTIKEAHRFANENKVPVFILLQPNVLKRYGDSERKKTASLTKYDAIKYLLSFMGENDFIVASSGNVAKEIYDIRKRSNKPCSNDLLLASAYGQTSSVAYGLALNTKHNVWCIDGDGAFVASLGSVATALLNTQRNLKYILIDDECQSSTGGQKSYSSAIDLKKILKAIGMKNTVEAYTYEDIKIGMLRLAREKSALIIKVSPDKPFKIESNEFDAKINFEEFKNKIQDK